MRRKAVYSSASALLALGFLAAEPAIGSNADSDDANTAAPRENRIILQPYVWVPKLDATVRLGVVEAAANAGLNDITDGFRAGAMGAVRYEEPDKFVMLEAIYLDYKANTFRPLMELPMEANILFLSAATGPRLRFRLENDREWEVQPYLGMRYLHVDATVDSPILQAEGESDWIDPVIGVTARYPLSDMFSVSGQIDASGFGLGDTDYLSISALTDSRLSDRVRVQIGYRYTKGDFDNPGGLELDMRGHGPVIGLSIALPTGS